MVSTNWSSGLPNSTAGGHINNGGTARLFDPVGVANTLALGDGPGNVGTLELLGGTLAFGASVTVGVSGEGTLRLVNGGYLYPSGSIPGRPLYIGRYTGAIGSVTVDGPLSRLQVRVTGTLNVGESGSGTLTVLNGGVVESDYSFIGRLAGSFGSATVSGGASPSNSKWDTYQDLVVGDSGEGELFIQQGGQVSNGNGNLGVVAGSSGTVVVAGAGSTWTNGGVVAVGVSGTGSLSITGGAVVTSTNGRIAREAGSKGTVTVDGPGSRWTASSVMTIGLPGTGAATLEVTNGGLVSVPGGITIGALGTVRGNGTIAASVISTGIVAPGRLPAHFTLRATTRKSPARCKSSWPRPPASTSSTSRAT